jgi:hypothetical protein
MAGWLNELIEVAGSVHCTMYFNLLAEDHEEAQSGGSEGYV